MSDLRRRVLDAALGLIAEQGVRAISFREVARRADVSHQAPYHIFENARGILRAIAAEGFAELNRAMREAAARAGPDPLDAFIASGIAYVAFARGHTGHFRVMFQGSLVEVHDPQAPLVEAEETHATLVELATAASRAGYGRPLPPELLATLAWATVHGLATLVVEGVLEEKGELGRAGSGPELSEAVVRGLGSLFANPAPTGR